MLGASTQGCPGGGLCVQGFAALLMCILVCVCVCVYTGDRGTHSARWPPSKLFQQPPCHHGSQPPSLAEPLGEAGLTSYYLQQLR